MFKYKKFSVDSLSNPIYYNHVINALIQDRFIVIKGVQNIAALRKRMIQSTKALLEMDDTGMHNHSLVGFHKYQNYLLFYANPWSDQGAKKISAHSKVEDCPSLYSHNIWPQIDQFKEERIEYARIGRHIIGQLCLILDKHMDDRQRNGSQTRGQWYTKFQLNNLWRHLGGGERKNSQKDDEDMPKRQYFQSLIKKSDTAKIGSLFYYPTLQKEPVFFWHNDTTIFTCLIKDAFFERQSNEVVPRPPEGGLHQLDAQGNAVPIEIEDDEILIQNGLSLQILTGGYLKANIHAVMGSKEHFRISQGFFAFPPTDHRLVPPFPYDLDKESQKLVVEAEKSSTIKFAQIFKEGMTFAEFHAKAAQSYDLEGAKGSWVKKESKF